MKNQKHLKLPDEIMQQIRNDGTRAGKVNYEINGTLLGYSDNSDIIAEGKIQVPLAIGVSRYNILKIPLSYIAWAVKYTAAAVPYTAKNQKKGRKTVEIDFESVDSRYHELSKRLYPEKNKKWAKLIFLRDADTFIAEQGGEDILVDITDKTGSVVETFGKQTPEPVIAPITEELCKYKIFIQYKDRSKKLIDIDFDKKLYEGIGGLNELTGDTFLFLDLKEKALETLDANSRKNIRHLEIKRDDGAILYKN